MQEKQNFSELLYVAGLPPAHLSCPLTFFRHSTQHFRNTPSYKARGTQAKTQRRKRRRVAQRPCATGPSKLRLPSPASLQPTGPVPPSCLQFTDHAPHSEDPRRPCCFPVRALHPPHSALKRSVGSLMGPTVLQWAENRRRPGPYTDCLITGKSPPSVAPDHRIDSFLCH